MREIISVFIDTNAPLATSKRQPQINAEDREQLLNTFTRTVFSTRPPIDIAYRCMRLDIWTWTKQALNVMEQDQTSIDEMLQQYLDAMKASRNAERLYHLWRGSNCSGSQPQQHSPMAAGGCAAAYAAQTADAAQDLDVGVENFVVMQKQRVRSDDAVHLNPIDDIDRAEQRIRSYTSPLDATLQDWFFVGMATEDAQHHCRAALCRKVVAFCSSSSATMHELIRNQCRMKSVADVILHHSAAPAPSMPSGVRKAKVGADVALDVYRNFFEAPLMNILSSAFSTPSFFGWADPASTTSAEKREMALAVLDFARATLHPTSVEPLLKMYLSSVFTSVIDCLGSESDVAARLAAAINGRVGDGPCRTDVAQVSLDSVALTCFNATLRSDGYDCLQKAFVVMAQSVGISFDVAPLVASLNALFSLPVHNSAFMAEALKRLSAAQHVAASIWGKQLIDFVINAAHQERLDALNRGSDGVNDNIIAATLAPSARLQKLWNVVQCGVSMDRFEPCYVSRLIQRSMASAASQGAADAEDMFAELFFPASSCPLQHTHRVRKLVADMKSSAQVTAHCALVMTGGGVPPPTSLCVISRIVAQEHLDKVTLPLLPKCLSPTLMVAGFVYSSQYQPTRTVSWLSYKSQITIARRRAFTTSPECPLEYTMSLAHFAVVEAVEDHYDVHNDTPLTAALLAAKLGGVNPHHVQVLVEDLVEAGGLLRVIPCVHREGTPLDAVVALVAGDDAPAHPDMSPIDVMLISSRRVARLRKRQQERCRPALECAILRLFKHCDTPLVLDSSSLIPPLLPLLPPVGFVVDPLEVEQAVQRLIARQYLALDASTNLVSYLV
jgi:hypothetical protein